MSLVNCNRKTCQSTIIYSLQKACSVFDLRHKVACKDWSLQFSSWNVGMMGDYESSYTELGLRSVEGGPGPTRREKR